MKDTRDKGIFSEAYPFQEKNKNNIEREKNIWNQFLELYNNVDEEELLEVVKIIINKVTRIMFRGSANPIVNIENRKKYAKINRTVGNLETDFFSDDKFKKHSLEFLNRHIFKDSQIKSKINDLFPNDFPAQNKFLEAAMLISMDTRMKTFLFNYVNK